MLRHENLKRISKESQPGVKLTYLKEKRWKKFRFFGTRLNADFYMLEMIRVRK